MARFLALAPAFLLLVIAVSGCLGGGSKSATPPGVTPSEGEIIAAAGPQAVVALVDTGINPYHIAFRDTRPLAYIHPSKYIPGYPADAQRLNLTLDNETSLQKARDRDKAAWEGAGEAGLYWIPGTKIIGAYGARGAFDTGHGVMTASRAAGNNYSLCADCRIVAVGLLGGEGVKWAGEQSWIDAQSNSWGEIVPVRQSNQELAATFAEAARRQLVFGSSGNGLLTRLGLIGQPSQMRTTTGAVGVVSVGGHDNGEFVSWSGTFPHVVADVCANWAAVGGSTTKYDPREGSGTSASTPYAAGAAARLVLEARRILNDTYDQGVVDGVVARANGTSTPRPSSGPLADGQFTLAEVKETLFRTAVSRPVATPDDGEVCRTEVPFHTYPAPWSAVPEAAPAQYFIGYGQISIHSMVHAIAVLKGEKPMPSRPTDDQWMAEVEHMREIQP